jgi:hypothetical protein
VFDKKEYMKEYRLRPEVKKRNNEYMKEYRLRPENKERLRQQAISYSRKRDTTIAGKLRRVKTRSKKINVEFNLTKEYLESIYPTDGMCPLLNIALNWHSPPKHDSTPSLDRIDNSKGYIKGNVQWVSWRANRCKNDATPDELLMLAQNYKKIYNQKLYGDSLFNPEATKALK